MHTLRPYEVFRGLLKGGLKGKLAGRPMRGTHFEVLRPFPSLAFIILKAVLGSAPQSGGAKPPAFSIIVRPRLQTRAAPTWLAVTGASRRVRAPLPPTPPRPK